MKRSQRRWHPIVWLVLGGAAMVVLIVAVTGRRPDLSPAGDDATREVSP